MYGNIIDEVIENIQMLKGIGPKSAERIVYSILEFDEDRIKKLAKSIEDLANKVKKCEICNKYIDNRGCDLCNNTVKKVNKLLIVEKTKDINIFMKNNIYDGYFHVLEELISPINGIGPMYEGMQKLLKRIENGKFEEIIIAIKSSLEGETTSQYIKEVCCLKGIRVSKIAIGVPVGAEFEYLDSITISQALKDRRSV